MAKVTQPLGSAEARGSVGGLTYNTWRGLHTVKTRSGPATQKSELQLLAIARIEEADAVWIAQTQATRDKWNAWAAAQRFPSWTGTDKRITGHNWFVKLYIAQLRIFGDPGLVFPPDPISIELRTPYLDTVVGNVQVVWENDLWPDPSLFCVEAWTHKPTSAGRQPYLKLAQFHQYQPIDYCYVDVGLTTDPIIDAFFRIVNSHGMLGPWRHLRWLAP